MDEEEKKKTLDQLYYELLQKQQNQEPYEPDRHGGIKRTTVTSKKRRFVTKEDIEKGSKRTASRISRFGKFLLKDKRPHVHTVRLRDRSADIQRQRMHNQLESDFPCASSGSLVYPEQKDISLSGAIRNGNWSGQRNLMNTKFFEDKNEDLI